MSLEILALQSHLLEIGLLGAKAVHFGGPDEALLCSSGPPSHLAEHSILCGPSRRRVLIRQPEAMEAAQPHSPLRGEIYLHQNTSNFTAEVEEWKHGCWYHSTSIFAQSLDELLMKLQMHTPTQTFTNALQPNLPQKPFWVGALAYDMVQWTQPLRMQNQPNAGEVLTVLWLIERMVIQDRSNESMHVHALPDDNWAEQVAGHLNQYGGLEALQPLAQSAETSSLTDGQHQAIIEDIRESIRDGQMYQVNVGRWWDGPLKEHPRHIFQRLSEQNPAPFSAFIFAPDIGLALVCSSPESLLKCDGEKVFTSPIKGTRPRGIDDEQEYELRVEMIEDEKERSEHRMLVDLMRNDIATVAKVGSIQIERFDVEAYAQVQHLVTHLSGQLEDDKHGVEAIQNVFPGGSITGCPRTVVCAAIDEIEQRPRSFWTGSIGWIDVHSGACSLNIAIRTLIAKRQRKQWHGSVAAGGGITIGSDPHTEVEEAKWKAAALREACGWIERRRSKLPVGTLATHPLRIESAPETTAKGLVHCIDSTEEVGSNEVLLIDNLDSFTLNIAHAVAGLGLNVNIYPARDGTLQDQWNPESVKALLEHMNPSHIILGPGPGNPTDSPLTMAIASAVLSENITTPVLGICLGHQAIGMAAGMAVTRSTDGPVHGAPRNCEHQQTGLFAGIESPTPFTRYNSLCVTPHQPTALIETAHESNSGMIMGLQHPTLPVFGVQFHPESVGSRDGLKLLRNFLSIEADA
ncbi:MAG: chorismate-binding protein [Candidatus Poseidoniaceae archaeon]|nr:chorismate-binding protein [Candidatus Poseidoniaceae archaeon]